MTTERWIERGLVLATLVVSPLVALLYLQLPPSIDQWQLDYTGWLVRLGQAPYVDIRDGNWPLSHWLHAVSVAFWGLDEFGWRRTDVVILLLGVAGGTPLVAQLGGRAAVRWFWFLHPILYMTSGHWFAGQRDIIAGHFGLAALALAWRFLVAGGVARVALAGAALTAAVLVKPTFALFALVVPVLAGVLARRGELAPREAVRGVAVVAGWSLAALLVAVLVLALQGATLSAFWDHAIVAIVTRVPADSAPLAERFATIVRYCVGGYHWVIVAAIVATVVAFRSSDRAPRTAAGLGWATVIVGVLSYLAQGHDLVYYAGPILVGLSALTAGALGQATGAVARTGGWRWAAIALIGLALIGSAAKIRTAFGDLFPVLTGERDRATWEARFEAGDGVALDDARDIARELAAALPADGPLLVWGRANVLHLLLERRQPSGFYHPPHFQRTYLPARLFEPWQAEFIADLEADPPAAAWVRNVTDFGETPASRFLTRWLDAHYVAGRAVGAGRVYVRRPEGSDG
ncbi:MAG: hypothetical protein NXI30_26865 [bacterium]|nr:hypothetical protein [bacterium]